MLTIGGGIFLGLAAFVLWYEWHQGRLARRLARMERREQRLEQRRAANAQLMVEYQERLERSRGVKNALKTVACVFGLPIALGVVVSKLAP